MDIPASALFLVGFFLRADFLGGLGMVSASVSATAAVSATASDMVVEEKG